MMKKTPKPAYDKPNTVIGEDTILQSSKLETQSSVQVNGQFIGDIEVKSSLVVGQSGKVKGNIKAAFVLAAGEIEGNIDVSQQIHLTNTCRIIGDIYCQSIVIDEGAYLAGVCKMKEETNKQINHTKIKKEA